MRVPGKGEFSRRFRPSVDSQRKSLARARARLYILITGAEPGGKVDAEMFEGVLVQWRVLSRFSEREVLLQGRVGQVFENLVEVVSLDGLSRVVVDVDVVELEEV